MEFSGEIFPPTPPIIFRTLKLNTDSWFLQFHTGMAHEKLIKYNKVCFTLKVRSALKASNILKVERKPKR